MAYKNFEQMTKYGGSFLVALCEAFMRADHNNQGKLCKAFPEVCRAYEANDWDGNLSPVVKDPFEKSDYVTKR